MKINGIFSIPQIIINELLALNFTQFKILAELNFLEKIIYKKICCHFRFYEESLIYPKVNFINSNNNTYNLNSFQVKNCNLEILNFYEIKNENCIYCLANKKLKKLVKFFCDFRNSFDEENNKILSYCEENEILLDIFDIENFNSFNFSLEKNSQINNLNSENLEYSRKLYEDFKNNRNKREKVLLVNDQVIEIENFFYVINRESNFYKIKIPCCFICNRQIFNKDNKLGDTKFNGKINKCEICLNNKNKIFGERKNKLDIEIDICFTEENFKHLKNKINNNKNMKKASFGFIEKLNLKTFFNKHPNEKFFEKGEKVQNGSLYLLENSNDRDYYIRNNNSKFSFQSNNSLSMTSKNVNNDFSLLDF